VKALTLARRATGVRKDAVAVTAAHGMVVAPKDVDPRDVAGAGREMVDLGIVAPVIGARKVADVVLTTVPPQAAAPKVADRDGPMARRDRRIRSGSSIALMKTKMAR
jgi:hypothetical protein